MKLKFGDFDFIFGEYDFIFGDFNFILAILTSYSAILNLNSANLTSYLAEILSRGRLVVSDRVFLFIFWKLSLLFCLFDSHFCQISGVWGRNEVV